MHEKVVSSIYKKKEKENDSRQQGRPQSTGQSVCANSLLRIFYRRIHDLDFFFSAIHD